MSEAASVVQVLQQARAARPLVLGAVHLQPCDGGSRLLTIYLATLVCPTSMPSLSNSPWIRGAPHSGLAMLISRISLRISGSTVGRPPLRRDFQRMLSVEFQRDLFEVPLV